jgi:uncharacterized protein (TIGR00369 family)
VRAPERLPSDVAGRQRCYRWSDPAPAADAARRLDGGTFFAELTAGRLPMPPIAETLGFTAVSVANGVARFELDPREFHYNPIGSVHGGVISTLCDSACGCAVHSLLPAGAYYTSLDLSVKFLRPVTAATGTLRCEGTVLHVGARSALAQASLTGSDGRLYAQATSSCMIFRP